MIKKKTTVEKFHHIDNNCKEKREVEVEEKS